jgi:DNA processing protein
MPWSWKRTTPFMPSTSSRAPETSTLRTETERLRFWLALARAPNFGGHHLASLLSRPGAPRSLFEETPGALRALGLGTPLVDYLRCPDWALVDRDLDWSLRPGHACVTLDDGRYPALLKEIVTPPPVLFIRGEPATLQLPLLAIVGSRNPSPAGEKIAFDFAAALCNSGVGITSGLAVGIDAASHAGALSNHGATVAVVGTGLDQVYPRRHLRLMEQIASVGAVVSEFSPGTPPRAANFPRRNRVISGLSVGTLVVEATLRSGSLITARFALEHGREVFAIPGSIHNPLARGCHALIKQGAKLVETVSDVTEELTAFGIITSRPQPRAGSEDILDAASRQLLKYVACEPTSVDTLVAATGYSAEQVSSLLVLLELTGHVASTTAGCYCRIT